MDKYIDREAFMQSMYHEAFEKDSDLQKWDGGCWIRYKLLENVMSATPPADVRPVVRGAWEKTEGFDEYGGGRYVEWTCSVCFSKAKGGWAVRDEHIDEPPDWNYCPNCGADMREKS